MIRLISLFFSYFKSLFNREANFCLVFFPGESWIYPIEKGRVQCECYSSQEVTQMVRIVLWANPQLKILELGVGVGVLKVVRKTIDAWQRECVLYSVHATVYSVLVSLHNPSCHPLTWKLQSDVTEHENSKLTWPILLSNALIWPLLVSDCPIHPLLSYYEQK